MRGDHLGRDRDARRFARSDKLVRFAGMDVTVYSSDGKRSTGPLSRQGSPEPRWATFRRPSAALGAFSDYAYHQKLLPARTVVRTSTPPV